MWIFLIGCGVIQLGGLLTLMLFQKSKLAGIVANLSIWAGCAVATIPVVKTLMGLDAEPIQMPWRLPIGEFHIALDSLSAFFMLPILLLAPLTAMYGIGYLSKNSATGAHYFFLNTLVVSMMMLLATQNAILFLIMWEVMAVSSFFLVTFDDHLASVREAGWTYIIATHIGVMALLAFFAILGHRSGDFSFVHLAQQASLSPALATALFLFAVVGFGSKAGIFPLHIWLPDAHPAAPSHVSALMSGAMIKMGIYGLIRSLSFIGPTQSLWGWILVTLGVLAGIVGIISALSQHNIKRMLAYSSVENIGIICMGIGTGILGTTWENPAIATLGFGGALLHVLNHSVFKGLLFLGAGTIVHETDTKEMNHMGGLLKKMPFTAALFFVGATAATALPPFNGFVSEFLIYFSGIHGALSKDTASLILAAILLTSLALIGGLTAAAFTKCAGLVFLGEPRKIFSSPPKDPGWTMKLPTLVLALAALGLGIAAPYVITIVAPAVMAVTAEDNTALVTLENTVVPSLNSISIVSLGLISGFAVIALFFYALMRSKGRPVGRVPVWDCGYAKPTVKMQYSPSSYSAPIVELFKPIVRIRTILKKPKGYFPDAASLETVVEDHTREKFFSPLFRLTAKVLLPFRILQHGHVHIYVIYVAVTLIALLLITAGN